MNNKLTLGKIVLGFLFASFYTACDESTTENITQVNQVGMDVVSAEKDLPECTAENEGAQAFVKGESSARICSDSDWVLPSGRIDTVYVEGGKDTVIVRDSVFVQGGTDTVYVNSKDTIYVVGVDTTLQDSGEDYTRKGFMLKGSSVYLYELKDGRSLTQTGNVIHQKIKEDDGFYKFSARDLVSQYLLLQNEGFYYNIVAGKTSDSPISLNVLTDSMKRRNASANVLTDLEYERVLYLVRKEKLEVWEAKRQAQAEILDGFDVDTLGLKDFSDAEDLYMFAGADVDNVLLAITVLLLGDRTGAEFGELLTAISNDISKDGEWNDLEKKKEIAEWAKEADESGRLDEIRERIVKGTDVELPDFIKYIRNFWQKELSN